MDPVDDGSHDILPKAQHPSSLSMTAPVEILDESCRSLRTRDIPLVKLLWRGQIEEGRLVEKTTWESEDFIEHQYPGLLSSGKLIKKFKGSDVLTLVLEVICQKILDFDDLFQVPLVCKEWQTLHRSYWENFMSSQAPLLLQTSSDSESCYFMSLSEQKVFCANMVEYERGWSFAGFSCGYIIISTANNSLLLINPFKRRKTFIVPFIRSIRKLHCRAMIAYVKGSEEFIIVLKTFTNLCIYQSLSSDWEDYVMIGDQHKIIDFVVFDHVVYFITIKAEIGIARLRSTTLEFLELNNVPNVTSSYFKLVSCDGKLLVVHFVPKQSFEVYEIDLSGKNWVRLESLGDVALFCTRSRYTRCYALSNPGKWGLEKNCIYCMSEYTSHCDVYSKNDFMSPLFSVETNAPPTASEPFWRDWCFRHVRDEVKLE